ncbi:MAG: NUDIX hydrolase, partial [Halioglobus sp.]|nr:NUDIX hydrolase [Halioglobus sp.]
VAAMVAFERASPVPEVFPVFTRVDEQLVVLFRGDAGYAQGDGGLPGARHRAVMHGSRWEYIYEGVDAARYPPLVRE